MISNSGVSSACRRCASSAAEASAAVADAAADRAARRVNQTAPTAAPAATIDTTSAAMTITATVASSARPACSPALPRGNWRQRPLAARAGKPWPSAGGHNRLPVHHAAELRHRTKRLALLRAAPRHREYDPGMSDRKARLTITVDPHLSAYAEHLVEAGQAASVSAAFNEAMAEKIYRDRQARSLWNEKAAQADPAKVARMAAHIDRQLGSH